MEQRNDGEILAVISAALAVLGSNDTKGTKLVVKNFKRINNASSLWSVNARLEQLRR